MSERLLLWALILLSALAAMILLLIGYAFHAMLAQATPDGRVPLADAGLLTALLLSFREVTGVIRSLWDHQDRALSTQALSNSVPAMTPNPPTASYPGETA